MFPRILVSAATDVPKAAISRCRSDPIRKEGVLQAFKADCQALVTTVAIAVVVSWEQIDINFLNLRDFSNV